MAGKERWPRCSLRKPRGKDWEPLGIPLRGPARASSATLRRVQRAGPRSGSRAGSGPLRVENERGRRPTGRARTTIPCRDWLDGYEWRRDLLGGARRAHVRCPWAKPNGVSYPRWSMGDAPPMRRTAGQSTGPLLAIVRWIARRTSARACTCARSTCPAWTRKFVERSPRRAGRLLDLQLARPDRPATRAGLRRRYGFRRKTGLRAIPLSALRLRGFGASMTVAHDDLRTARDPRLALITLDDITYLAFSLRSRCHRRLRRRIRGGRARAAHLARADLDLIYWGDIDTHGFAILNRLRHTVRPRSVNANGPRHAARVPQPVGNRAAANGRQPGSPEWRGGRPLPGSAERIAGPVTAAGAGADRFRCHRESLARRIAGQDHVGGGKDCGNLLRRAAAQNISVRRAGSGMYAIFRCRSIKSRLVSGLAASGIRRAARFDRRSCRARHFGDPSRHHRR